MPHRAGSELDHLVAELKSRRRLIGNHDLALPAVPGAWNEVYWSYDELLVVVANMLEVPNAPPLEQVVGRRRLTVFERCRVERDVVEAGVDLPVRKELGGRRALRAGPRALPPAVEAGSRPAPTLAGSVEPMRHLLEEVQAVPAGEVPSALADWARGLRQRLHAYEEAGQRPPVQQWDAELDAYDEALVLLAALVGEPTPSGSRSRLLAEERDHLERRLSTAGVDLST